MKMKCYMKNMVVVLSTALLFSGCSNKDVTEDVIDSGRIINLHKYIGEIDIERTEQDETISPYQGLRLIEGDIISTDEKGEAFVVLDGDKVVKLHESTTIELAQVERIGGADQTVIKLIDGEVTSSVTKLDQDENYQIETQNATMGVRGTIFTVAEEVGEPVLKVYSGEVGVKVPNKEEVVVHKMQQMDSIDNRSIEKIEEIEEGLISDMKEVFEEIQSTEGDINNELAKEFNQVLEEETLLKQDQTSNNDHEETTVEENKKPVETDKTQEVKPDKPQVDQGENDKPQVGEVGTTKPQGGEVDKNPDVSEDDASPLVESNQPQLDHQEDDQDNQESIETNKPEVNTQDSTINKDKNKDKDKNSKDKDDDEEDEDDDDDENDDKDEDENDDKDEDDDDDNDED